MNSVVVSYSCSDNYIDLTLTQRVLR